MYTPENLIVYPDMTSKILANLPNIMYKQKMYIKWNSKISGIYAWINNINGKLYIGQSNNLYKRVYTEMNGFKNNNHQHMIKLFNAINKYGLDNFRVVILLESPVEYLNMLEMLLIKYYNSNDNGYNCNIGGDGNRGYVVTKTQILKQKQSLEKYWTDDNKKIHSDKMRKWFNSNPEHIQQQMKNGNVWWENPLSKEKHLENVRKSTTMDRINRQKQSLTNYYRTNNSKKMMIVRLMSPLNEMVQINGLSNFCKLYRVSMLKIRMVLSGKLLYHEGWHLPSTDPFIPKYEQIVGPDGVIYKFTSITDFCKTHGLDKGNLRKVLNGCGNQCKGFRKM